MLPKRVDEGAYAELYAAACPGEAPEYRPDRFVVGSREFLPDEVGFRHAGYDGFVMDTTLPSNVNSGHEYAAGRTPQMNGDLLPPLCAAQRRALLEYLKTL